MLKMKVLRNLTDAEAEMVMERAWENGHWSLGLWAVAISLLLDIRRK